MSRTRSCEKLNLRSRANGPRKVSHPVTAPAQPNPDLTPAFSRVVPVVPTGSLPIFITVQLEPGLVRKVASVDPRVVPISAFVPAKSGDTEDGAPAPPRPVDDDERAEALAAAEVLFTFWPPSGWLEKAPNLRWVQLASAGADRLLREDALRTRPDLLITTASGIHEVPISEHILGMILHFTRRFDEAIRNQQARRWERLSLDEAHGKTVCFIGYGPIARRAATLCKALGMRILVVRASLTEPQPGIDSVDGFYPLRALNEALSESDFVVVAAPRTPVSEGMIGFGQFAVMKPNTVLINISRGALVDEPALVEALQKGRIAGAGLDVFAQEPLPESSPLWSMPNVLVTPHVAGSNPHYTERATDLFCDNLARYLRGEPLRNLVNVERGY